MRAPRSRRVAPGGAKFGDRIAASPQRIASAARRRAARAISSCEPVALRRAHRCGSSSISTWPALTLRRPGRGWRGPCRSRAAGSPWCGRSARSCPARWRRCRRGRDRPRRARCRKNRMMRRGDRAADRRGRGLDDLQRRRQELAARARARRACRRSARQRQARTDDVAARSDGLHGALPAARCSVA